MTLLVDSNLCILKYLIMCLIMIFIFKFLKKNDIRDNIFLTKYTSFSHLCAILLHYQFQVILLEKHCSMVHVTIANSDTFSHSNKFSKPKNHIKINKTTNIIEYQVVSPSKGMITFPSFHHPNCKYATLFEPFYVVMLKLINDNIIKLPPIILIYTVMLETTIWIIFMLSFMSNLTSKIFSNIVELHISWLMKRIWKDR